MNHTSPIVGALLGSLLASVAHAQQPASAPSEDSPAAPPSLVALARGAALDPSPWRWSSPLTWPARPSQAAARVVLPESIWSRANADLSDLRIVTGDAPPQQLAFVLNQDVEATALLTRDAARPAPQPEHPGWSVIELPLEHTHIPELTVRVTTTQCPFSRTVEIVTRRAPSNRAAATRQ
ncbi:MAG: hypothetical protein CMH57_01620 [Myxococcales bacterium]|nr:hypothetical protein [Myxococcales bacterium]